MNRNNILKIALYLVFLFILSISILAFQDTSLIVTIDGTELKDFFVIHDNNVLDRFFLEEPEFQTNTTIQFFENNNLLLEIRDVPSRFSVNFLLVESSNRIKLIGQQEDQEISESFSISFCNYDSVCDSFSQINNVFVSETYASCNDCSEIAYFCKIFPNSEYCFADCGSRQQCIEYLSKQRFCVNDYLGAVCDDEQECLGETIDSIDGECCLGNCVNNIFYEIPENIFSEDYGFVPTFDELLEVEAISRMDYEMALDEEYLDEEFYKIQDIQPEYLDLFPSYDIDIEPRFSSVPSGEEVVATNFGSTISESFEVVKESRISKLLVLLALLATMTLITLAIYNPFTKKNKNAIPQQQEQSVYSEIDYYIKQGYSYDQIRTILLNKGYDLIFVNSQLMAHYQSMSRYKR